VLLRCRISQARDLISAYLVSSLEVIGEHIIFSSSILFLVEPQCSRAFAALSSRTLHESLALELCRKDQGKGDDEITIKDSEAVTAHNDY
jgi:hypothetical protein